MNLFTAIFTGEAIGAAVALTAWFLLPFVDLGK